MPIPIAIAADDGGGVLASTRRRERETRRLRASCGSGGRRRPSARPALIYETCCPPASDPGRLRRRRLALRSRNGGELESSVAEAKVETGEMGNGTLESQHPPLGGADSPFTFTASVTSNLHSSSAVCYCRLSRRVNQCTGLYLYAVSLPKFLWALAELLAVLKTIFHHHKFNGDWRLASCRRSSRGLSRDGGFSLACIVSLFKRSDIPALLIFGFELLSRLCLF